MRSFQQPDDNRRASAAIARRGAYHMTALVLTVAALPLFPGCGSSWKYSYIEAERAAANQVRDLLICYRDHLDLGSADLEDALKSAALAPVIKNYVRCSLVSAYAPNRKYMAQFGVTAPPAVVVLHTDGTFHAKTENLAPATISDFLASANAPGARPRRDITVPRATDYLLRAEGVYDRAVERAQRLNRNLLIVYKWWLDDDSTKLIARMSRPEVAAQCTNTINCVLDWDFLPNRRHVAQYGVQNYPAIIVVHRDGSSEVLRGLASVDRIVGFLSRALGRGSTAAAPNAQLSAAKPGWRWSTDLDRAGTRARRAGKGLFAFFHSPTQEASARVMRLLQSNAADALLTGTVRCSVVAAQYPEQTTAYGIDQAPACVGVRPDGATITRQGAITFDDLSEIQRFLDE